MRLPAEQTSPWLINTPKRAPSIAASKSASAKKMLGDFPPSSRVTRFTESAACLTIILPTAARSEEHTSELQSQSNLVCRLLLEKKKNKKTMRNEDCIHDIRHR